MTQQNPNSNLLIKILGSAALAGFVAIVALAWSIYTTRSEDLATEKQIDNQATQIAKQDMQISLIAEQNRLLSEQATNEAQKTIIENQLQTPIPTNDINFAPTSTALANESIQLEATRQAIEEKQRQIQIAQTAIAKPLPTQPINAISNEINIAEGFVPGVPETRVRLTLSENQLVMGTADKFQDVLDQSLPPFAVFVIYGPIDENIILPWGGWDQWRNATSSFVESELQDKVQQTKDNHPTDWRTRGINIYRCSGSVSNCSISSVPTN